MQAKRVDGSNGGKANCGHATFIAPPDVDALIVRPCPLVVITTDLEMMAAADIAVARQ